MFRNRKIQFALIIGIIVISVSMYLVISKRGHKNERIADKQVNDIPSELVLGEVATFSYDLENPADIENYQSISDVRHLSGSKSCSLSENAEFSVTINKKIGDIPEFRKLKKVKFSFSCFSEVLIKNPEVVLSIEDASGKSVAWLSQKFESKPGAWKVFNFEFDIKDVGVAAEQRLKVYVWNKGHEKFFIDDLTLALEGLISGKFHSKQFIPERNIEYDFETVFEGEDKNNYVSNISHSGKTSFRLNADNRYSPSLAKKIEEVIDSEFKLITMSCWLNQTKDDNEVLLVAAIKNNEGKEIFWQGRSTEKGKFPNGEWVKHRAQFKIPSEIIKSDDVVSVYAWNKGGAEVFVDDFLIVYGETNVRSGTTPALDMTTVSDSGLVFTENSKVLKTAFLKKYEFNGSDSLMALFSKSSSGANIGIGGNFVSGKFASPTGVDQQVAVLSKQSVDIIGYCISSNSLNLVSHKHKSDISESGESIVLSGDFYGNATDEIAVISLKRRKLNIFGFQGTIDFCAKHMEINDGIDETIMPDSDWNSFVPEGADVVGIISAAQNLKKALLFIDLDSGIYSVVNFSGSTFSSDVTRKQESQIAQNSKSALPSLSRITQCNDSGNLLLLNYVVNGKRQSQILSFNQKSMKLEVVKHINDASVENSMQLILLNHSDCEKINFLSYDDSWKFSLNRVQYEAGSFSKLNNVDFSGFASGFNPKYYEMVRMFGIKLRNELDGVLVIFGNCNDPEYSGGFCNKTDTQSMWYPRIQYYYLDEK
jgi:hypothetical protein